MKRILLLALTALSISTLRADDFTIGLQTGAPASLIGARVAYMGGSTDSRGLIVDGTMALTVGWSGNVGVGYAIAGGPLYVGARYHYLSIDFLGLDIEGGAVGPEIGYITPIFGSQSFYFNAFAGVAFRDDFGDIGVMPNVQVGLNIAL